MYINILILFYGITFVMAAWTVRRKPVSRFERDLFNWLSASFWALIGISIVLSIRTNSSGVDNSNWSTPVFVTVSLFAIGYHRYISTKYR